ncbi:hypothetical protein MA16_Dca026715 [Dendrobium catenatum]|uniref:Uncharacterized protein n=1 Tax=Dendrobium catenatum TaxID=906689 RepID=A0A2I0VBE1_9ASPA|nr:hypothetical protein MA16_Dca026715 [Dendrobium catenatum]
MAMVYSLTRAPYPCKLSSSELLGTKKGRIHASKSGSSAISQTSKGCRTCRGRGAIECPGCKELERTRKMAIFLKDGSKCYDCQGFGLKSCPNCGSGGLTPEQRGER